MLKKCSFRTFCELVNSFSWGKKKKEKERETDETAQVKGNYFHSNFFQTYHFVLKSSCKLSL